MKLFYCGKDGGPDSPVTGFWLIEIKSLFSIAFLKFNPGCRENYHSHAFNSISWLFRGTLIEDMVNGPVHFYDPSFKPIMTRREDIHKVHAAFNRPAWALTLRGPWSKYWFELDKNKAIKFTLSKGRKIVVEERYSDDVQ